MRRTLYLMFIYLVIAVNLISAQSQTDSLLLSLKKAKGKEKVDILNSLAVNTRQKSLNQALDYANQALKLSKEINYLFGEGESYQNRGIIYYFQRKYPDALTQYELAYNIYNQLNNKSKLSAILNNRAIIGVIQGEYDKALLDYEEALEVNIELKNWSSVANIYNNIGMVYSKWGNSSKTIENYNKSLEISLRENNKVGMAAAYNNIALVKKGLGDFDEALEYYQKSLKVNEENGDIAGIARCLTNISAIYKEMGDDEKALSLLRESMEYEKQLNNDQGVLKSHEKIGLLQLRLGDYVDAIESFENSIEIAKKGNDNEQVVVSYRNIGNAYENLKNYNKAIEYYKISLKLAQDIENSKAIALANYYLGKCYHQINNFDEAINYTNQSINISRTNSFIDFLEDSYKLISEIYKNAGDYKQALNYQSKYIEIHTTIYNEQNQKRLTELQTRYETEKKEKEILELKSEKEKTRQKYLMIVIIATISVLLVVILLLYSRFLIKKRSIKMLDKKNEQLEQINKELKISKEKAEESDRLKTAFLANVSHEIRTPLNAIIGFSEFLVDPDLEQEQKFDLLNTINLNSDMLLGLIDDILDIARIESGQLRIKYEKVSLNKLMEETFLLMKNKNEKKREQIEFKLENRNDDIEVYADSFRIKQILINLIDNSFKFTNQGKISFGYELITKDSEKYILFEVTDTGVGIDEQYHDKIFDMFYKVPRDKSVIYRGTGIGLSIVKNLIEQMGGEISFESKKDGGTKFHFTIPYLLNSKLN